MYFQGLQSAVRYVQRPAEGFLRQSLRNSPHLRQCLRNFPQLRQCFRDLPRPLRHLNKLPLVQVLV
jgi:hypothetical protein